MNSEERILQILDNSACLSKGQLIGYLKRNLYPEELRAVELHLAGCPLCNDALEGYEKLAEAESVLASIKLPVLPAVAPREKEKPKEKKEQLVIAKAVKPEAVAAAAAPETAGNDNHTAEPAPNRSIARLLRPLGIAAALVIGAGAIWYFGMRNPDQEQKIAQNSETLPPAADSVIAENRKLAANVPAETAKPVTPPAAAATPKVHKDSLIAHATKLKEQEKAKQAAAPVAYSMQAETAAAPAAADNVSEEKAKEEAATEKRQRKTEDNMAAAKAATKSADLKEQSRRKQDSDNPQSDFEKGLELYKQKQYASALLYLRSAESDNKDPRHWDAVYYSALCNKALNKKRRAIKQFQRVVESGASQKNAAQKQLNEIKGKEE